MDSLDWSKKYEVLSMSRLQLESLGIPHEKVASLTDEDMARIAETVAKTYPDFENRVRINVSMYLLQEGIRRPGLQYTIIEEPAKQRWYPLWRDKDQESWNHFLSAGEIVSCPTQPQAQAYIDTWSRKFAVLVISRPYLHAIGLSVPQVHSLTDEDMQAIADTLQENFLHAAGMDFHEEVRFVTSVLFAQRSTDKRTTGGNQ